MERSGTALGFYNTVMDAGVSAPLAFAGLVAAASSWAHLASPPSPRARSWRSSSSRWPRQQPRATGSVQRGSPWLLPFARGNRAPDLDVPLKLWEIGSTARQIIRQNMDRMEDSEHGTSRQICRASQPGEAPLRRAGRPLGSSRAAPARLRGLLALPSNSCCLICPSPSAPSP